MNRKAGQRAVFHPDGGMADTTAWKTTGVIHILHLSEEMMKHDLSKIHMDSCLKLSVFRWVNIATRLDKRYRPAVCHHSDEVNKY